MKTRREQIKDGCENHPRLKDIKDPEDRSLYRCAFIDGAEFADANPSDWAFTQQKFETEKLADPIRILEEMLKTARDSLIKMTVYNFDPAGYALACNLEAHKALNKMAELLANDTTISREDLKDK